MQVSEVTEQVWKFWEAGVTDRALAIHSEIKITYIHSKHSFHLE